MLTCTCADRGGAVPRAQVSARVVSGETKARVKRMVGDAAVLALDLVRYQDGDLAPAMRFAFGNTFICKVAPSARCSSGFGHHVAVCRSSMRDVLYQHRIRAAGNDNPGTGLPGTGTPPPPGNGTRVLLQAGMWVHRLSHVRVQLGGRIPSHRRPRGGGGPGSQDQDTAQALALGRGGTPGVGCRCVSLEGDDFSPGGTLTGGRRAAPGRVLNGCFALAAAEGEAAAAARAAEEASTRLAALVPAALKHARRAPPRWLAQ